MKFASDKKPTLSVQRTNKAVSDQGFTYNEAGKTYNELGMVYAGIYGYDIEQITSHASQETPHTLAIGDLPNTLPVKTYVRGSPIGLLLDLTFNTSIVIFT